MIRKKKRRNSNKDETHMEDKSQELVVPFLRRKKEISTDSTSY
jgi:hypothetical protein